MVFGNGVNPDVEYRGMAIAWSDFAIHGRHALPARAPSALRVGNLRPRYWLAGGDDGRH